MGRLGAGHWSGNLNVEPVAKLWWVSKRKEQVPGGHVIAGNDEQVARSAGLRKNKIRGSWVLM